jgi:hypothetical protein
VGLALVCMGCVTSGWVIAAKHFDFGMTKRDEFLAATIRTLANRAGHRCSNPECPRPTSGPALAEDKSVNVGQAAHITAAAPGGKRYDASLTPRERRAASNGIWLCQLCAKLIDTDEARFTVDLLRKWKQDAEERAFRDIATTLPGAYRRPAVMVELDDGDRAFLISLALPQEDQLDAVLARMLPAARRDIATFRNTQEWPSHAIALNLTLRGSGGSAHAVTIEGLANGIGTAETLNIVAPPGTGKTTTLVQLAETLVEAGEVVAGFVPLGEWSDRRQDFYTFLTQRNAFGSFRAQHFMQLAYHGRFALVLDGWNELDPAARVAATRLLKALRRDYPLLGIVIGTRRHLLPIFGAVVEVEPLSENQQLELARALRGQEGEALVDQAWRTPGVRDLVTIPLYLTALLRSTPGARFPRTKEEVLRLFVTQHEEEPEKAAILQKELFGFHSDMLTGLGVEANRAANTVLSDTSANRIIANVGAQLAAAGQFTNPPQPATAIEVLVSSHLLIRASSGGISFQHQQFQEWYASLDVGRIMRQAANGNAEARTKLRADILNWPAWEESVLFACERLSRENAGGAQAVATASLRGLAARRVKDAETETRIEELIASTGFPARNDQAAHVLQEAQAAYPGPVRKGLQRRIATRLELPFRAHEFLTGGDALDEGPVVEALLDVGTPELVTRAGFVVVGPKTVGAVIDRLFELHEAYHRDHNAWGGAGHQAEREELGRLRAAIEASREDSFLTALLERAQTDDPARIEFLADLLRWHGRPERAEEPSSVGDELRSAVTKTLQRWMNALLESQQANRHHLAAVSRAMTRFPDPQFVPGLCQMLERDLADWARAREERAKAPHRGPTSPDVTHDHTLGYRSAFAAIGNDAVIAVLKEYLPDPRFGVQAAGALLEIWNRDHPSGKAPIAAFGQDYSRAKLLERQRREAPATLATCDYAESIFEVARSIGTSAADSRTQQHAIVLAVMGLGMPHGSKRAEIDALLAFPVPYAGKQRLLIASAMAGEVLRSDILIAGLEELLEAGKTQSWRLAENHGELMNWVELFAFSDHPEAVIGVLDRLPQQYGYPSSLDRLLSALAKSPHEGALDVLQALARRDPRLLARHDWAQAVIKLGTEKSGQTLLRLVCDGELGNAGGVDSFHLSRQLAHLGEEFPSLKEEMLQRYQRLNRGRAKSIIESALIELADPPVIRALLRGYAADHRPYDGGLSHALRSAALGRRPVEGWNANAYEEFSVSLAEFRRELFGLALTNDTQSRLAESCLVEIEELRDEHGRVDDEPRHPDISSDQPWPIIR